MAGVSPAWKVCGLVLLAACCARAEKPERPRGHEQVSGWTTNVLQSLEYGVLLEVEGFAASTGGESESDLLLATAAFDLEASLAEWLSGHVGLLWEQYSRETDNLDEAYVAVGSAESTAFYFVGGRFYQPVGNFETAFVSDPLTLELAEMNKTGAMVGYGNGWVDLNAGTFNGSVKKGVPPGEDGDSTLSDFHAGITFFPHETVKFGAYWLSDLMESWTFEKVGEELANLPGYDKDSAAGAFANFYLGRCTFNAEYVSALEGYDIAGGRYVPAAFNLEGSVKLGERVVFGLKYEASNDLYATFDGAVLAFGDKFPGEAAGAVVSYAFHENATVAVEYLHAEKLDDGARGDLATVQLALAF